MKFPEQIFLKCFFLYLLVFSTSGQAQQPKITFLALGDSYTIGESVSESKQWPTQLAVQLRKKGIAIADPKIIAKTGWTTDELKQAISESDLNPPFDIVSLLIGVNDQYRGYKIEKYPENFRYLLEKAIHLAGSNPRHVIVLSIPDYGVTSFAQEKNPNKISRELAQYNSINKSISDSLGVRYVNITPISKEAKTDPSLLASDDLHPSGKMYSRWVDEIVPIVLKLFKK